METLSRIDSLKDEQKAMESTLEEKRNEIKRLRDKDMNTGNENPQVIALTATLKQKEAEIEELKHLLNPRLRVRSVSTDGRLNSQLNMTVMGSMEQNGKIEFSHMEGGPVHESLNKDGDNLTKGRDENETKSSFSQEEDKREGVGDGIEKRGGQLQKLEKSGANTRNGVSEDTSNIGIDEEKNRADAIDTINDLDDEQEKRSSLERQLGKRKDSHQESRENGETDDDSRISRLPGRIGHLSRSKVKRWRTLARNRSLKRKVNSGIDAIENMTNRRLSKEYKDDIISREDGTVSDDETKTEPGRRKEMDDRKVNYFKQQNYDGTEDVKHRKMSGKTSHQVEGGFVMQRNHINSLAVAIEDKGVNREANNCTQGTDHVKVKETDKIKQNMNMYVKEPKKAELNSANGNETEEDIEVAYEQEPETEAHKGDVSGNFMSESSGGEENKEETDEPEF
ncbi:Transferase, folic acid binding isoform 1 [Hibiscus syriacus]|uniref:Transferase, folic acid binding isoform 1 n=2 Tax=Hibiscus syriacus TaxID=106335 RepID=A0A6A3CSY3_HIBSY|nr:Transferase, folic acid binding isoform 1 [Hibiscus syriacus]